MRQFHTGSPAHRPFPPLGNSNRVLFVRAKNAGLTGVSLADLTLRFCSSCKILLPTLDLQFLAKLADLFGHLAGQMATAEGDQRIVSQCRSFLTTKLHRFAATTGRARHRRDFLHARMLHHHTSSPRLINVETKPEFISSYDRQSAESCPHP